MGDGGNCLAWNKPPHGTDRNHQVQYGLRPGKELVTELGLQLIVPDDSQFSLHCTMMLIFLDFQEELVVLSEGKALSQMRMALTWSIQSGHLELVSLGKEQFEKK